MPSMHCGRGLDSTWSGFLRLWPRLHRLQHYNIWFASGDFAGGRPSGVPRPQSLRHSDKLSIGHTKSPKQSPNWTWMALSGQLCGTGVGGSEIRSQVQVTVAKANCSGCLQLCRFVSKRLKLPILPPIKKPLYCCNDEYCACAATINPNYPARHASLPVNSV